MPAEPSPLRFWLQDEPIHNYGDALSPILLSRIAAEPPTGHVALRLIGSVIADFLLQHDLGYRLDDPALQVACWGCGMRDTNPLTPAIRERLVCYGVRGPLSRKLLGLDPETPLGDPAMLLPWLYAPAVSPHAGRVLCVPHFHDTTPDEMLLSTTGADVVLRPNLPAGEAAVLAFTDALAGASFVLAGAMHAAIVACAYGVPFAYLDTGYVDIPFKWLDFAASVGTPAVFVRTLAEAHIAWRELTSPALERPPLLPLLRAFPGPVRDEVIAAVSSGSAAPATSDTPPVTPFYDLSEAGRVALTHQAIREKRSLTERWSALGPAESAAWNERAAEAARMLSGEDSVADLGCGDMQLERHLPASCRYVPVDLIARDARTIVADFNLGPVPALDTTGFAVLGLLEYLFDVPGLLAQLRGTLVVSYNPDSPNDQNRAAHGWVNAFTEADFEQMFRDLGLQVLQVVWLGSQVLWKLRSDRE